VVDEARDKAPDKYEISRETRTRGAGQADGPAGGRHGSLKLALQATSAPMPMEGEACRADRRAGRTDRRTVNGLRGE